MLFLNKAESVLNNCLLPQHIPSQTKIMVEAPKQKASDDMIHRGFGDKVSKRGRQPLKIVENSSKARLKSTKLD